jgi:hypothetical protein
MLLLSESKGFILPPPPPPPDPGRLEVLLIFLLLTGLNYVEDVKENPCSWGEKKPSLT